MPRVFISHSARDRDFVEAGLIPLLREHHIDTWYCREDIRTAEQWERAIRSALKETDWLLVVVSKDSIASDWVHAEVSWALDRRPRKVVPVLIDGSDPSELHLRLGGLEYVDFQEDLDRARRRLIAAFDESKRDTDAACQQARPAPSLDLQRLEHPDLWADEERFISAPNLGKLRLLRHLTVNGWGPKYHAKTEGMETEVAIQLIRDARFSGEARQKAIALLNSRRALRHPSIIRRFEAFAQGDCIYIVEEFIDESSSLSVRRWRQSDDKSLPGTMELLAKVADGLQYAHTAGVVHGWICPPYIIIDKQGVPHLGGFEASPLMSLVDPDQIRSRTMPYSSPEVLSNPNNPDARSDIWSMGVILHELLYGRWPFQGIAGILRGIEEPEVSRSRKIDAIWKRCLEPRKDDRFQTAADLASALRRCVGRRGLSSLLPPWN